jgi:hypothetical protein
MSYSRNVCQKNKENFCNKYLRIMNITQIEKDEEKIFRGTGTLETSN